MDPNRYCILEDWNTHYRHAHGHHRPKVGTPTFTTNTNTAREPCVPHAYTRHTIGAVLHLPREVSGNRHLHPHTYTRTSRKLVCWAAPARPSVHIGTRGLAVESAAGLGPVVHLNTLGILDIRSNQSPRPGSFRCRAKVGCGRRARVNECEDGARCIGVAAAAESS